MVEIPSGGGMTTAKVSSRQTNGVVADVTASGRVMLAHGGGGTLTDELIRTVVLPAVGNDVLGRLGDSAVVEVGGQRLAMTTDGYVVEPLEFPGGDIGRLAVCGTVNDLAMAGAEPMWLSLGMILEEGLDRAVLERVMASIAASAEEAGVLVVTGDTKVVERGRAEGMYLTTAGVGRMIDGVSLGEDRIEVGDVVIVSGKIAEHGLAVMSQRKGLSFASELASDVAVLAGLANSLVREVAGVRVMHDPTRGGVAGIVADLAAACGKSIELEESRIPISPTARGAAEMLGLDPLTVANEGKFVMVVAESSAEAALAMCREHRLGRDAAIVGRVSDSKPVMAELITPIGGRRIVQKPYGEQLPRIC